MPPEPTPPEPTPPEPTPPEPPPAEPPGPPDTAARIERLLEQAEADFRADRLTRPPGANAQLRYLEVLELAPEHPAALAGLRRLGYRYLELAAVALERGRRDQARAYLDQAQRFVPGEPELAELRERAAAPPRETERGPEPAPDLELRQQCLQACDGAFAACREEAQAAADVESCMRERRRRCEAELSACKGDAQKLFVWGQIATESACNGEYHQCMQRAEGECEHAGQAALEACEVEAGECRRQCP
jgi:hypothetical protein